MYKIGPNKFMGGGGVCGRGEKGGVFCSVCNFHNQKMQVYLILYLLKRHSVQISIENILSTYLSKVGAPNPYCVQIGIS